MLWQRLPQSMNMELTEGTRFELPWANLNIRVFSRSHATLTDKFSSLGLLSGRQTPGLQMKRGMCVPGANYRRKALCSLVRWVQAVDNLLQRFDGTGQVRRPVKASKIAQTTSSRY